LSVVLMMAVAGRVAVIVNVLVERIAYRPLRNAPRLVPLISALRCVVLPAVLDARLSSVTASTTTRPITACEQKVDSFGLGFLLLKWLDVLVIHSAS
jgi:branched-subunit amino acid ABC-type transport system permease component